MANVDNSEWNGQAAMSAAANSDDPAAALNAICAGKKAGDPKTEAAHALPHHKHPGAPPNAAGVRNAESRISQTQGLTNKEAAQAHLDAHMKVIQAAEAKAAPVAEVRDARRAAAQRGEIPGGHARSKAFSTEIRGNLVQRDGRQLYHVEGYATVFNRGYEMWDMFGSYTETVDGAALDRSLAANPDVSFLVNHKGLTMARTVSRRGTPTLTLEKDSTGLHIDGYLNYDRQDVRDLASAISDELVDEMSFAFMLDDGEWNDDYTAFRITQADINRGDVSAVNYGANPYTSIQARSADILADLEKVPEVVARAAVQRIQARLHLLGPAPVIDDDDDLEMPELVSVPAQRTEAPGGKSLRIWQMRLGQN